MELSLIIGISVTVLALAGWIVASLVLHRHARGVTARLDPADRAAAQGAHMLYERATAAQMAAMASAQRQ